ncbi:MAG: UDP-N-acetylmuramoyl-L-alanine--D-glutamate ligase [Candidatus Aureabacteria bacterium]|nr:UDP-N-acetylmuramoyl-L-alanine--D-glutamate ligase [Candidatus Auribacterota bacterium]
MNSKEKFTIFGLGISGYWAARLILQKTDKPEITVIDHSVDDRQVKERSIDLQKRGIRCLIGEDKIKGYVLEGTVVVSPGVDTYRPDIKKILGKSTKIIGEIELAFRFFKGKTIGVTGTNGKSTVVKMIEKIFNDQRISAFSCGNIGYPLSQMILEKENVSVAIIEVSSFQLHHIEKLCFDVAMFIDLSQDHLDRYNDFDAYAKTKLGIFRNQKESGMAVIYEPVQKKYDDLIPEGCKKVVVDESGCSKKAKIKIENEKIILCDRKGELVSFEKNKLSVLGKHNLRNAVFSLIAALYFDVDVNKAFKSLINFNPLPHRLEIFHVWKGIQFVDDSKSTTPDSTLQAVLSFTVPVHLILGGRSKGADFNVLRTIPRERILNIILIGETQSILKDALKDVFPVQTEDSLLNAVEFAIRKANVGEIVLLSPACASFDMFKNYKERGAIFKRIVRKLAA